MGYHHIPNTICERGNRSWLLYPQSLFGYPEYNDRAILGRHDGLEAPPAGGRERTESGLHAIRPE